MCIIWGILVCRITQIFFQINHFHLFQQIFLQWSLVETKIKYTDSQLSLARAFVYMMDFKNSKEHWYDFICTGSWFLGVNLGSKTILLVRLALLCSISIINVSLKKCLAVVIIFYPCVTHHECWVWTKTLGNHPLCFCPEEHQLTWKIVLVMDVRTVGTGTFQTIHLSKQEIRNTWLCSYV